MAECPICLSRDGFSCERHTGMARDGYRYDCEVCGSFIFSRSAAASHYEDFGVPLRAILSRRIRLQTEQVGPSDDVPVVSTYTIEDIISEKPALPTPAAQATNIVRYVGEYVASEVKSLSDFPPQFHPLVGAPDRKSAEKIAHELRMRGLLAGIEAGDMQNPDAMIDVNLTLSGWEVFEEERKGLTSGKYGFIALKFGEETLDALVKRHIKPALNGIGYEAVDMRDVAQAGVIDNIMRMQIRDCAFLIADLTHENAGAYWEAGFAEGLGKPVLYICESKKFDREKTHFDTNHCTTVLWSEGSEEHFAQELVATIRRSLV